jgi:hypothetical protein
MRDLLAQLLQGSPIYTVEPDSVGYIFVASDNRLQEFSDLVRLVSEKAGDGYMVFPTPVGRGVYSGMYIVPLPPDEEPASRQEDI